MEPCYWLISAEADLTVGHSCSGRRGPWESGPWRPPGVGPARRTMEVALSLIYLMILSQNHQFFQNLISYFLTYLFTYQICFCSPVPTTGSWSNPETVGDLMGEGGPCSLHRSTICNNFLHGGRYTSATTNDCNERIKKRQFNMQLWVTYEVTNKAITENNRNYSVCKSSSFTHTISA